MYFIHRNKSTYIKLLRRRLRSFTESINPFNYQQYTVSNKKTNGSGYRPVITTPKTYTLKDLTGGQKLRHPNETTRETVQYFVDSVLNNSSYDAQTRERLVGAIQRSEWYNQGIDDAQINNLFTQAEAYAKRGEVPNRKQITEILGKKERN